MSKVRLKHFYIEVSFIMILMRKKPSRVLFTNPSFIQTCIRYVWMPILEPANICPVRIVSRGLQFASQSPGPATPGKLAIRIISIAVSYCNFPTGTPLAPCCRPQLLTTSHIHYSLFASYDYILASVPRYTPKVLTSALCPFGKAGI